MHDDTIHAGIVKSGLERQKSTTGHLRGNCGNLLNREVRDTHTSTRAHSNWTLNKNLYLDENLDEII